MSPGAGFHNNIRHSGYPAHRWGLVVQDEHLIMTNFSHEVKMLLHVHINKINYKNTLYNSLISFFFFQILLLGTFKSYLSLVYAINTVS